jgi:hypothetical protein
MIKNDGPFLEAQTSSHSSLKVMRFKEF